MRTWDNLEKEQLYREVKDNLFNAVSNNTLSHAFIFEGLKGSKKELMANELSKKILDTEYLENCSDYFLVTNEKMNIETIRFINKDCYIKPFKARKIYIFEDAAKMTPVMQNAFLKTLEEPPADVVFILLCENAGVLLDTIRSRCVSYYFPSDETGEDADIEVKKQIEKFFENLVDKNEIAVIQYMEELKNQKDEIDLIIDVFIEYTRDVLVNKESERDLYFSKNEVTDKLSSSFTYFQLLAIIDIIEDTRKKLSGRCNYNLTCEAMLFNIMEVLK